MKIFNLFKRKPKSCSKCKHEKPFPVLQNKNYSTYCGILIEKDSPKLMHCIRKSNRSTERLSRCPL